MAAAVQNSFYRERFTEIQERLRFFHSKMKNDSPLDFFVTSLFGSHIKGTQSASLSIDKFREPASAGASGNVVKLPPWYLFKYEDIPAQFRIHDANDPRLTDPNFLNQFAAWINGKITEFGLTSICRPADFGALQRVILLLRDPVLFAKSKDFVMGHEVSHLSQYRREQLDHYCGLFQELVSFGGITTGICILFAVISIVPVAQLSVTIGVSSIAIGVIGASTINLMHKSKGFQLPLSQIEEEKKADLDSARVLGDVDGGVYYFQTQMLANVKLRNRLPSLRSSIDERGNNLRDKDHPLYSDRVDYLKKWKAEFLDSQRTHQARSPSYA